MTITTNALGANSVEIVVTGGAGAGSNVISVFNAVNTFIYTQGWSLVPDGTLTGNSTNVRHRVYQAPVTNSGAATYPQKYVKINLMDLTLDTATAYTANASTTGTLSQTFNATNPAYRFNHYQHLSYPRDSYFYRAGSDAGTQPYQIGGNQLAVGSTTGAGINSAIVAANITSNTWTIGQTTGMNSTQQASPTGFPTISLNTGTGYQFYPGQQVNLYSPSTGHYVVTNVNQYNDANGQLYLNTLLHSTAAGVVVTDWALLAPTLAYNTSTSPAYVYVSASARHIAIQTRNVDGTFNDWCAVVEMENPLGLTTAPTWGLTTGYMSANSGYTEVANLYQVTSGGTYATMTSGTTGGQHYYAGQLTNPGTTSENYYVFNAGAITVGNAAGTRQPCLPFMNKQGKLVQFTGPFAVPLTYKGRTGNIAAQFNKVITTIGEAGYIGTIKKEMLDFIPYPASAAIVYVGVNALATVYFKGLGDVVPNVLSTPAGTRHWAISASVVTDIADDSNFGTICDNTRLDTYEGRPFTTAANTVSNSVTATTNYFYDGGINSSYRDQSQYRTAQPTPLGRMYGMKYVTTGIQPLQTMSIRVDSSGFVSNAGTATDHLVMSYPSQYVSPTLVQAVASGNAYLSTSQVYYPVDQFKGKETFTDQANIRISQSVAVAFPK
jgi:hypothetical protein